MDLELLVTLLDLAGTFAFALVGARIAANKGLDYGGIAFIAAIASLAGGTFRNLLLGEKPPWVLNEWLFLGVILAIVITLSIKRTTPVGRFVNSGHNWFSGLFGIRCAIRTYPRRTICFRGNSWANRRRHWWLIARCTLPGRTSFAASRNNWNFLPSRIAGICQL